MPAEAIVIRENEWREVTLTATQLAALNSLGQRLASDKRWWGDTQSSTADDARDTPTGRSVLRCERISGTRCRLRVTDCIGAISVAGIDIIVEPKIPTSHLIYLLEASSAIPRLADQDRASIAEGVSFWRLLASWYLREAERLLRRGLIRDYRPTNDILKVVRGRANIISTARDYYAGRIALHCEYEDFDENNALNRCLLAAARHIVASPLLDTLTRRRARRLTMRFENVDDLHQDDTRATTELRTHYYTDALILARSILTATTRTLAAGTASAWTFLFRTPSVVEEGVRGLLRQALVDRHEVERGTLTLAPSSKTLNPDLVFDGGAAVADIKYKVATNDWQRSDLYQVVTFATGYRASRCAIIGFSDGAVPTSPLHVGDVTADFISWPADARLQPQDAASRLAGDVVVWLEQSAG